MIFDRTYGIDLGSDTVKIFSLAKGDVLLEKNLLAYRGHDIIAVGEEAAGMAGKVPADTTVLSPLSFGKIDSLELQEIVLYKLLGKLTLFPSGSSMYFTVPPDLSAIDKRAYYQVVNGLWLKGNRVYTVEAPVADALALSIDIDQTPGCMLVNVGDTTTRFGIFFSGKLIMNRLVPIGGKTFEEGIVQELRRRTGLVIGCHEARRLKVTMGRLMDQKKESQKVVGFDSVTGLPRTEEVSSYLVNAGIMNAVNSLAQEMKTFLERLPPQVSYSIQREGISLTGGSSHIPFLDKYLASYTGFTMNLSTLYEYSGVRGLEAIVRSSSLRKWVQPIRQRKLR